MNLDNSGRFQIIDGLLSLDGLGSVIMVALVTLSTPPLDCSHLFWCVYLLNHGLTGTICCSRELSGIKDSPMSKHAGHGSNADAVRSPWPLTVLSWIWRGFFRPHGPTAIFDNPLVPFYSLSLISSEGPRYTLLRKLSKLGQIESDSGGRPSILLIHSKWRGKGRVNFKPDYFEPPHSLYLAHHNKRSRVPAYYLIFPACFTRLRPSLVMD